MPSKLLYTFFLCLMSLLSCKGQDRLDLSTINFNIPNLAVEEKPLTDEFSIYPPSLKSYQYQYKNMDAFCFGNFKFKNGGIKPITSTLYVFLDEKKKNYNILKINTL